MPTLLVQDPSLPKCAIDECVNACYVDESGTVHECCGLTHAMEHKRRQALWQRELIYPLLLLYTCLLVLLYLEVNKQVVKGVTHCLLPDCDRHTWPFENYCGKTHADLGLQQKLIGKTDYIDRNIFDCFSL